MPDPVPISDSTLLRAAARGDHSAFESLYRRHRDFVLRIAQRHAATHEDALDATQDTFIHLLHKLPTLTLTGTLTTYLYPIAKNAALARARQSSRRTEILRESIAPITPAASQPTATASPDAALESALAALPEDLREVLLLRTIDNLTTEQTALALSIPQGTVKSRLHAALNKLRAHPGLSALMKD